MHYVGLHAGVRAKLEKKNGGYHGVQAMERERNGEARYSGQQFNTTTSTGETRKKGRMFPRGFLGNRVAKGNRVSTILFNLPNLCWAPATNKVGY